MTATVIAPAGRAPRRGGTAALVTNAGPALRRGGAGWTAAKAWPALRLAGGVALIGVLVWQLGAGAVAEGLRAVDAGTVLVAVLIGLVSTVASAWRWCVIARAIGLRLRLRTAVADYYQALLLNSVLPAGILGDVGRAVGHGRRSGDVRRGVRAVVLERMAGQLVLVAVAAGALLVDPTLLRAAPVPGWGFAVLAGALAATGWILRARLRGLLTGARATLRPGVLVLSAVALAGHLATFLLAARAAGVGAPVAVLLPLLVLALAAMSLPLNVGGWGPREAAAAVGFGAVGLGASQGLATAVVYGVLGLAACAPGALVVLVRCVGGRVTGTRRTTAPGSPAVQIPSPRTPATVGPPRPTPCTPAAPGSAGAAGRRRPSLAAAV